MEKMLRMTPLGSSRVSRLPMEKTPLTGFPVSFAANRSNASVDMPDTWRCVRNVLAPMPILELFAAFVSSRSIALPA